MPDVSRYAEHSAFSDPGDLAPWVAALPADLPALHHAASQLVFDYGHRDQFAGHGIAEGRLGEIDTRYADGMFRLVRDLSGTPLGTARPPNQRMIGCRRDDTLFLVPMARQHGVPARSRVGFATYFSPGWIIDHVVAEIWDALERRWRLVEANLDSAHVNPTDGQPLDVLDLPRDRFLVAAEAWCRCRLGAADPARFVVNPALEEPFLRGWPYLLHNLMTDLAALDQRELVLWDVWGIGNPEGSPGEEDLVRVDALATDLATDHPDSATISRWLALDDLRIPNPITSWSPSTPSVSRQVTLRS